VQADGPNQVFAESWKADPEFEAVSDYFQVEGENGERYWIFRAGDGEDAKRRSEINANHIADEKRCGDARHQKLIVPVGF